MNEVCKIQRKEGRWPWRWWRPWLWLYRDDELYYAAWGDAWTVWQARELMARAIEHHPDR